MRSGLGKGEKILLRLMGALTVTILALVILISRHERNRQNNAESLVPDVSKPRVSSPPPTVKPPIIVDSAMTREEALSGNSFPKGILDQLVVVNIEYNGFDRQLHHGQLVVNKDVERDVKEVFKEILAKGEQIEKAIPIVAYNWSDSASISDNNTSAFNYRKKIGPGVGNSLSRHSFGRAIDVNPFQNPFIAADGSGPRPYRPGVMGTIDRESPITKAFLKRGWIWGGEWVGGKDYQHFEKPEPHPT